MAQMDFRSAIADANQQFMEAFRRGDADALAKLYTADGQLFPPNQDILIGRENIRGFWQAVLDMELKAATLQTIEVRGYSHAAVEVGRYTLVGESGQVADAGKYVVVWRNDAGNWLLHQDIWNTSLPAAGK